MPNANLPAASKTPKNPGLDGMATPIAMIPCVKSAVANGARMPKAS